MSSNHHHGHAHGFGQDKRRPGETKTLIVIALTAVMMVVEVFTGILFGSMALLADGMHMASHAVALGITAFAYWYARKHAHDHRFSFGTGKVNALGGYTGAILLALFALVMAVESVERLINPTDIAFNSAIAVAVIGLLVNGASVFILGDNHDHGHGHHHEHDHHEHGQHHHHDDHNLRSAYLHVMADALTSLTAIGGLLTAKYFGWIWMDPVMGLVGSALVARWSIGLLKQTSGLLLDHQADDQTLAEVRSAIEGEGRAEVEDLHVWSIGPGIYSVILGINTTGDRAPDEFKAKLAAERFPHITVELHRKQGGG